MRFLIDEDLPRSLSGILHQFEHEAVDVRDISLRGANDSEIASYARKNELCLLTGDFGFADIRNYPPVEYFGIVVLRTPAKTTSLVILNLVKNFLASPEATVDLKGKLAIVELNRVRIRKG